MSIGLLGTILGAVSGAGNAVQASLAQDQKADDNQQFLQTKAALDLKNQQILQHSQAVDIPNALRTGLLQRIAPTQDQLDAATIANAQADPDAQWVDVNAAENPDGTAVAGTPTVKPAIGDLSDADKVQYAPTDSQILALKIANAQASGDFGAAAELTKIAEAAKRQETQNAAVGTGQSGVAASKTAPGKLLPIYTDARGNRAVRNADGTFTPIK